MEPAEPTKKKSGPKPGSKRSAKTEVFSARVTPKQKIALQKILDAMNEISEPPANE